MTSTKIGCLRTFAFAALSAAAIHFPAFADMKPVAIWNGEFGVKSQTRNGVTLSLTSSNIDERYATLKSTNGPTLEPSSSGFLSRAIIANIHSITNEATDWRCIFTLSGRIGQDSAVKDTFTGLLLTQANTLDFLTYSNTAVSPAKTPSSNLVLLDSMHSFGVDFGIIGSEARGYLDGHCICSNNTMYLAGYDNGTAKITLGTLGSKDYTGINKLYLKNYRITGGLISYIALFPYSATEHPTHEDFALWSLPGMTNAENVAANGVIVGGENTGVNLTNIVANAGGCRYSVSGNTSLHALFVQEDSTLVFTSPDSALTVAGPVYIAPGRRLAVEIGENGPASGKLIETRKFADKNQLSFPETLRVEYDDSAARYSLGYAGSAGANHGLTILFR